MNMSSPSRSASPPLFRLRSARLALVLPLFGVLAAGQPQRAEACTPAQPYISAVRPAADEAAVPTNARIWLVGLGVKEVTLTAGTTTITTQLAQPVEDRIYFRATPSQPLLPNTRYTVTAKSDQVAEPRVYSFTTGAGEDLRVPAAPAKLAVTAQRVKAEEDPAPCSSAFDGYRIEIDAAPVEGAALYELAVLQGGRYVVTALSEQPILADVSARLPTPMYRVRPVAITGLGADDGSLPSEQANDAENEGEGGCSASSGTGSSSLLALMAGLLGWSLWRRRGVRSPVQLGVG